MVTARKLISLLKLEQLPQEGGHFRQTYLCPDRVAGRDLPRRYTTEHSLSSAIYYLLMDKDFSAIHRLQSDELYHFYFGDPVEMLLLYPDGSGELFHLGIDFLAGERPQKLVPHGTWQGSRLIDGGSHGFCLMGTTMSPAFDWDGFELGQADELIKKFPAFREEIKRLTDSDF